MRPRLLLPVPMQLHGFQIFVNSHGLLLDSEPFVCCLDHLVQCRCRFSREILV